LQQAIDQYWDEDAYREVIMRERAERLEMLSRCEE
jgi:hypothetical protein